MTSLIKAIPKNYLSFIAGKVVSARLPFGLSRLLLYWFIDRYRVNIYEMQGHLSDYATLSEFFVRRLKKEVRPIGQGVVSPVDGKIVQCGKIENDRLLQVKGKYYYLDGLLRDQALAKQFENGFYLTLYLSPRDYHRIHAPCSGVVTDSYLIEGNLWPVNGWSTENVDNLFSTNERVTTLMQTPGGNVAVVKVGATNVGSISVSYDTFRSNDKPAVFAERSAVRHRSYSPAIEIAVGDEVGVFNLGSTVILLFEKDAFKPSQKCVVGQDLLMGETIGEFL